MSSSAVRLPSRFPVGTRFVIEGRGGRISQKYLEFPDGRHVNLKANPVPEAGSRASSRRQRSRRVAGRK